MKYEIELTDTFAGEANYSWVRRATIEAPENISDSTLIRRAKQAINVTGRHKKEYIGDAIALTSPGACIICFITPVL